MYSRRIWKGPMCVVLESSDIVPEMEESLWNELQYKCHKKCVCIVFSRCTRGTISRGSSESTRRALLVTYIQKILFYSMTMCHSLESNHSTVLSCQHHRTRISFSRSTYPWRLQVDELLHSNLQRKRATTKRFSLSLLSILRIVASESIVVDENCNSWGWKLYTPSIQSINPTSLNE